MSSLASAHSAQRDLERQIERQIKVLRAKNEEIEELRARIKELEEARRASIVVLRGEWKWEHYRLFRGKVPLLLSPMESELASLLIHRAGRLVRYENIFAMLYPNIDDAPVHVKRVIWVIAWRLRRKGVPIRTIWGRGLLWECSEDKET